jgi:uncharacterized protein involved in exopolysaccharide biosynthesis
MAQDVDAQDTELGFWEILHLLWAKRLWLIAAVVVCTLLMAALAFNMTPVYRSSSVLVPASVERDPSLVGISKMGQLGGLASLAGINLGSSDMETEEALAILRSRQFTEAFITQHNLMPKLFAKRWDAAAGGWKPGKKPPTLVKGYEYFDRRVRTIGRDKKTGLVTLKIEWKDPDEAATWATALVEQLNRETRNRALAKSDAALGYLRAELNNTTITEVREAINRLIEAQVKQRMLASVSNEYAFRTVDKALPADRDDPVRPRKFVMIAAGPFVGFFLGLIGVLVATSIGRQLRRSRSASA